MATTDKTIITAAGRNMLVDLDNNNAHANGFNIYFSTGDLTGMTDDQLVNLQDIQSKDIKVPATVIHLDQGDTRIRAEATYNGPQKGIYINTYATYAVDANGNELLFAIYLNSEPQYLLASTTSQDTTQGYGFNIGISQTDNVDFTKLADNVATLQDVKTMIDGGDAVTIHGDQTIIGNKNFTGNIQVNGKDVVSTDQLTQAISNFSGDDKDHNFTAKLQHNGIDVVDSNELNQAISNFSGDDKNHNFTADLQYKGIEVATTNDTNNAFQNAVNTAKGNSVQDNHDGTITINGTTLSVNQHISPANIDLFTITKPGTWFANWNDNSMIHFPSTNTASVIKCIGTDSEHGLRLEVLDSWGNLFISFWNNDHYLPWRQYSTTPTTFTNSEQDAINDANISKTPALFVYPTDTSTTNAYKHVLGIYAFGTNGQVPINLTNLNNSEFSFINAYALWNPNNNTITFHGSIQATTSVNANDSIFELNISSLNMNEITSNYLNSQTFTAETDGMLQNVISASNYSQNSGYVWNLEGCTITLGYDSSLKVSMPSWVPSGTTMIDSPVDLNSFNQIGTFYTPNASNFVNAPSQMPTSGGAFLCTQWTINGVCFTENIYTDNPAFKASRNCTTRNAYDTTAFNYNWNYGGTGAVYNNSWGAGFDPNFKPSYIN